MADVIYLTINAHMIRPILGKSNLKTITAIKQNMISLEEYAKHQQSNAHQ